MLVLVLVLVLVLSAFASVKSPNRAARAAGRSLLAGLRPLPMPRHHNVDRPDPR